ncbi:MAG: hypothetical protein IJ721_05400 [Bacteroidales bacterium]|nr:hypothetical protein [Bacteroidales bacterium]
MDPRNTIKSLIPEEIIKDVPVEKRNHVATKIVLFFQEADPDLYAEIEKADLLPDELRIPVVEAIREAALKAREHHLEMVRLYGGKPSGPSA